MLGKKGAIIGSVKGTLYVRVSSSTFNENCRHFSKNAFPRCATRLPDHSALRWTPSFLQALPKAPTFSGSSTYMAICFNV
jgi:hypothetical protein